MSLSVYCVSLVTCGGLERSSILADYVVTLTVSIVIFPIVVHWCWHHQGWLAQLSYQDQAGAGVIHVVSSNDALRVQCNKSIHFMIRCQERCAWF